MRPLFHQLGLRCAGNTGRPICRLPTRTPQVLVLSRQQQGCGSHAWCRPSRRRGIDGAIPRDSEVAMNSTPAFTLDFSDITLADVALVGGKNASLGELFGSLKPQGVGVVDGFATTADAYRPLLAEADLEERLRALLTGLQSREPRGAGAARACGARRRARNAAASAGPRRGARRLRASVRAASATSRRSRSAPRPPPRTCRRRRSPAPPRRS